MTATLSFHNITKVFPGVKALSNISFDIKAGSVHGLLGENGAGKSTLLKVLGGEYAPEEGCVKIEGVKYNFSNSRDSINADIAIIHQELQYIPDLNVVENLLIGRLPNKLGFVKHKDALAWSRKRLQDLNIDIDPLTKLKDLSIGQRQMVEICKAVLKNAKIIALDEPTSSLSHNEVQILFKIIKDLRFKDHAMIYISHRMEEIFELCDSCTVFRDGRKIVDIDDMRMTSRDKLVTYMVGREISDIYSYRSRKIGATILEAKNLLSKKLPTPLNFSVRSGEIVGIFGLVGAGRSDLLKAIYGVNKEAGEIFLENKLIKIKQSSDAIKKGIVFCPEDRKEEGIIGCRSVSENINISSRRHLNIGKFFINLKKEKSVAIDYIDKLRIKTPNERQPIRLLSGGNQQKVILARWLTEKPLQVLMIDEPTRGIDVGAKNEIYRVLYSLAEQGIGIILVSSELPEILGVVDRVIVMKEGHIVGELDKRCATEKAILDLALPN